MVNRAAPREITFTKAMRWPKIAEKPMLEDLHALFSAYGRCIRFGPLRKEFLAKHG
jgi:hypothetical protein